MQHNSYYKKGGETQPKPKPKMGKKAKPKEPQIVRYYFEDEPFEYAKGGGVKADNNFLIDKAISSDQKKVLKDIVPILNKKGIQLRMGTYVGKSPQTIIIDKDREDGILSISGKGYNSEFLPTFDEEEFSDKEDFARIISEKFAKGGAIYKGNKVKIKETGKTMKVTDISKGKKGYVEFTGSQGSYLKGDIDKMAKGDGVGKNRFKLGDKVKVVKGANKGVKGIVSNTDSDFFGDYTIDVGGHKLWGFTADELIKYAKGGTAKPKPKKGKKGKPKEPQIVRYYFEDEPFEYAKGGKIKRGSGENSNQLMGYEPHFEKDVAIATIFEKTKEIRPTHGYFPKHPMSKKAINWAKKNGYTYVADGKKYEDGGMMAEGGSTEGCWCYEIGGL